MFHAVIFDLDGTLLNTIDDLAAAGNFTLKTLGFSPYPVQAYKKMVGGGIPVLVKRFLPPQCDAFEQALQLFLSYYTLHKNENTLPYPGILDLLQRLKAQGIKLGIVSNKEDSLTKEIAAHYFPNLLDAVSGHTFGTAAKPNPHLVNQMRNQFACSTQHTLYVGDSDVDILTAHNAHLKGCGVLWGFRSREELIAAGADTIADTIETLEKIILE